MQNRMPLALKYYKHKRLKTQFGFEKNGTKLHLTFIQA